MAWKVERWLSEVFPGEEHIYSEYRSLNPRELAVVCAAVLDLALAELIALRLSDSSSEVENFLGLDGDGRTPAASLGARIQLGLLLEILTAEDAAILRTLKDVRNAFAHRVKVTFLSPAVQRPLRKLYRLWYEKSERLMKDGLLPGKPGALGKIERYLGTVPEAGEGLLLSVFTVYQAYFHRMHPRIQRVGSAISSAGPGKTNRRDLH